MPKVLITGSGSHVPSNGVSNGQLVQVFNDYVLRYNEENLPAIEAGQIPALEPTSCERIEQLSGIRHRYFVTRQGILDPEIMQPLLPTRADTRPSLSLELALPAIETALQEAGLEAGQIDLLILASTHAERAYPSLAIELQHLMGTGGIAYELHMEGASAAFAIAQAEQALRAGQARRALIVCPEINSAQLDFRDRESHFLFGDGAAALVLELSEEVPPGGLELLSTRLWTRYANEIRNNFGYLNRTQPENQYLPDKLYHQQLEPLLDNLIPWLGEIWGSYLQEAGVSAQQLSRVWLQQANVHIHRTLATVLTGEFSAERWPLVLDRYANTGAAGALMGFHCTKSGLGPGMLGALLMFGAGYTAGAVLLRRSS